MNPAEPIGPLSDGSTVDLAALGTNALSIQVNVNKPVHSISFWYQDQKQNLDKTAPYSLGGDTNGYFVPVDYLLEPGSKSIMVKIFRGLGDLLTRQTINFLVVEPTPPVITGFTLINALDETVIGALEDGTTIDLGVVGTALNVRADTFTQDALVITFSFDGVFQREEGMTENVRTPH
jgi:hypothetical protein